jgi:hypothetical protein
MGPPGDETDRLDSASSPCETNGPEVRIAVAVKSVSASGLIALVAVAGLLVGACGSSGTSSTSSTPSASPSPTPSPKATLIAKADACTLVTIADVLSATGLTVTSLAGTSGASIPGACFYATADASTSVLVFAQVYPDAGSAAAVSPDTMAAALNGSIGIANAKAVNGIGDKAVEYSTTSSAGNGAVIFVFKSNVVMFIALTPAADTTGVEKLATIAVGKL